MTMIEYLISAFVVAFLPIIVMLWTRHLEYKKFKRFQRRNKRLNEIREYSKMVDEHYRLYLIKKWERGELIKVTCK